VGTSFFMSDCHIRAGLSRMLLDLSRPYALKMSYRVEHDPYCLMPARQGSAPGM
jgi:hypothetical protein